MCTLSGGIALIEFFFACVAAILLHEGFHITAAKLFGDSLYSVRPTAVGVKARLKGSVRSYKKQILIYFAGSFGNLLTALVLMSGKGFLKNLSRASLAIGLFNLLPLYPLDGGQIFIILAYKFLGVKKTIRLIRRLSAAIRIGLVLTGIAQFILFRNPSLIIAAAVLPGTKLLEETMSMMKLDNLLHRKRRIINKRIYAAGHIVVLDECTLGEVLQKLDYDRFHIIYVINREMEIIGQLTEQHIIKAIQSCKSSDRIGDVFFLGM